MIVPVDKAANSSAVICERSYIKKKDEERNDENFNVKKKGIWLVKHFLHAINNVNFYL